MTIHTNIQRRNGCMPAVHRIAMTVKTAYLVDSGMYLMRIKDRLLGLIILLAAQSNGALYEIIASYDKETEDHKGYIYFITIERNWLMCRNTFLIVGKLFQAAVHLQQDKHND